MFPWLAGQGLLALLLACLALYYLVLYPESNCYGSNAGGDCTLLLWHSVIMVLSLMLLIYYIYVVSDFVGQLKARRERDEATLDQLYTIERQEKRDKKQQEKQQQQQAVEWQQQILSESDISRANPAQPFAAAAEQGPILNERGLLQQFAQPSYLPDVPLQSAVPAGAMYYPHQGDSAAATPQFIHPVQILQVDPDGGGGGGAVRSQMSQQQQQQHDGYRLLSVLPAAAHSPDGTELPHYENQSAHQLSDVKGKQPHPVPPPRPLKRRPPPSLEADSDAAAKGHYENAGYLRDAAAAPATDESPSQREVVSPAAADSKETETTGTTTAESAETTRSDQSASDEKRKKSLKRVRILE